MHAREDLERAHEDVQAEVEHGEVEESEQDRPRDAEHARGAGGK
jgi:hypothetical protein